MRIQLTSWQKSQLEADHKKERDRRIADRQKAVLLRHEGWTQRHIAQALRIHEETVHDYLSAWSKEEKLAPTHQGSFSKLTQIQKQAIESHLQVHTYTSVKAICSYVKETYGISYTLGGMTKWLRASGFVYKKPKGVPAKADAVEQKAFIVTYNELKAAAGESAPILFMDSVHPTQGTKLSYGWIKKGYNKQIATTASRTRMNITGAINLKTMEVISGDYDAINGESTKDLLEKVQKAYPEAKEIHVIADQASYHRSKEIKDYLEGGPINIHLLPAYSPNLNPIERLWKVLNEQVRNNRYFATAKEFRRAILRFFEEILPKIGASLAGRINDNLYVVNPVNSS